MKNKVLEISKELQGYTEIGNNAGFESEVFQKQMLSVGWYKGAKWCAFYTELFWLKLGQSIKHFSGSAWQTALNHIDEGYEWSEKPTFGALVVWRNFKDGNPQKSGHIGIVLDFNEVEFISSEGNITIDVKTKKQGVGNRRHSLEPKKWKTKNGLRLMGFVHPKV